MESFQDVVIRKLAERGYTKPKFWMMKWVDSRIENPTVTFLVCALEASSSARVYMNVQVRLNDFEIRITAE